MTRTAPRQGVLLLGMVSLVLLLAIAAAWSGYRSTIQNVRLAGLLQGLPREFPGWEVEERRVADSPEMQRAVADLLNYDEAVFRTFRRGGADISIYAAYWRPRKYPARLVAQHVPENCWQTNGWRVASADYNRAFILPRGESGLPVQDLLMEMQGTRCHVRYWHVCGGELSGFASGPASHSIFIGDAFWRDLRTANAEQMFIRLSTNRPWSEWEKEPLLAAILQSLAPALTDKTSKAD